MSETQITVVGNVAWPPNHKALASGVVVADFRIAHTPSRLDKATGEWRNLETMWYGVTCWRGLADNVAASLHKGDRVIVTGRLSQRSYEKDGQQRVSLEIDATSIGFDLSRCPVVAARPPRPVEAVDASDAAADEAADEAWDGQAADPLTGEVLESAPEETAAA
jgi:single-strand DNA-binding protein